MADLAGLLRGVSRHRLVERFGVEADAWCDDLQALIDAIARIWRLRIETLLPGGANSIVLACTSDDGESLVLKLTPDLRIAAEEAAALSMWASCRHVVALKDSDIGRGALLLEAVGPGVKLSDDPGGWSLEDVAPMLAGLWEPRAVHSDSYLPKLSDRVDVVFDLAMRRLQRWVAGRDRVGGDVMDRSHACARELAAAGPAGLVHGDLHPGNVLRSDGDYAVVAIDPRPCWGDRAFDAADWMLSEVTDERALERRIDWLARNVAGVDPSRVWAWCQATSVIIAMSLLGRRGDDPTGAFLLRFANEIR